MEISKDKIKQLLVISLKDLTELENIPDINDKTDINVDLGLDSNDGLDFACDLSEKLGINIPAELNPFVDDDNQRYRLVGEIVEVLLRFLKSEEQEDIVNE